MTMRPSVAPHMSVGRNTVPLENTATAKAIQAASKIIFKNATMEEEEDKDSKPAAKMSTKI